MKEFYEKLKKKREAQNLSLEELHKRTRLPIEYLQALENGELEKIPHGYDRIYLRRFAKEVGLDPEEVIRDYNLLTGKLTLPEPPKPPEKDHKEKKVRPVILPGQFLQQILPKYLSRTTGKLNLDRLHKYFWIGLAALTFLIVGYFAYKQYIFEKSYQNVEIKEITISELVQTLQEQDSTLTPQMSKNTVSRSEARPQLTVELRSIERTWIREIRDEQDTTEYILPTGIRRSIEAVEKVKFVLGRADGVEVWLNGQNLGVMGEEDEVVLSLIITEDGIAYKRLKKVQRKGPVVTDSTATGKSDSTSAHIGQPESLRQEAN